MTTSNTYNKPYGPKASLMGVDIGGTLSALLNEQRGVDGQLAYANDIRQSLVFDQTNFNSGYGGAWTPVHGTALLQSPAVWLTSTVYYPGNYITHATTGVTYICLVQHTSGTFATDLASGDWAVASVSRYLFDDFRGTIDPRYSISNGAGASAASPVNTAGKDTGEMVLTGGTANGATACSAWSAGLGWEASQVQPWQAVGASASAGAGTFKQLMTYICKAKISNITALGAFLGFTDTLTTSATTSQLPLQCTGAISNLIIGATNTGILNAAGFLFDSAITGQTSSGKAMWAVSSNAGTPTTGIDTSVIATTAPYNIAAATYMWFKITVDTGGNATFYMAPVPATGSPVWLQVAKIALAVAPGVVATPIFLTPAAQVASRSATSPVLTLDAALAL